MLEVKEHVDLSDSGGLVTECKHRAECSFHCFLTYEISIGYLADGSGNIGLVSYHTIVKEGATFYQQHKIVRTTQQQQDDKQNLLL